MGSGTRIDDLISQREEIDRQLRELHSGDVAVLFTDMVGSTEFFERKGDIEGVALVQRHNRLLFPVVEANKGRVIKTIGDAIMAVFDDPPDAVRCAAAMQRTLQEDREGDPDQPIHIRIGAHAGRVMHVETDVFGDTVNTAARVEAKAEADEILLSASLFTRMKRDDGFDAVPRGNLRLKGKSEPLPVVALVWREGGLPAPAGREEGARPEMVVLELGVGREGLKVALIDGARAKGTVKSYTEVPIALETLDRLAADVDSLLRGGAGSYLDRIRELGAELLDKTLPAGPRRTLEETSLGYLRLQIDDRLAHVPWELLHDGRQFLGTRFAVGRLVAARSDGQTPSPTARRDANTAGHALVVSDPAGDLPHAAREGDAIAGLLRDGFGGEVKHLRGPCTRSDFLGALTGCQLLHFAGHAVPPAGNDPGGFRLADGLLAPADVADPMRGSPPALVVVNSCFAATGLAWTEATRGTNDIAATLLLQGVQHYVGPTGDIPDQDALAFALRFYEQLLAGDTLGTSVRHARRSLAEAAAEPISFAGYLLYGDPRDRLAPEQARLQRQPTRSSAAVPSAMHSEGTPLPPPRGASGRTRASRRKWAVAVPLVLIAGAVLAVALTRLSNRSVAPKGASTAAAPEPGVEAAQPAALPRTGAVRLSVMPFNNSGKDAELQGLSGGIPEALMTELGGLDGIELVERQALTNEALDRDAVMVKDVLGEIDFGQGRYVDSATAAALGKLRGTEVVIGGAFQRAGATLRITGRLIDVETGEVLQAMKVQGAADDPFTLQDEIAARAKEAVIAARARLRPKP